VNTIVAYVTDELIADSPQSVEALLQNGFRDGLNFLYNEIAIHGTGAGQGLGYVNAPCAVSVAVETGQTSGILWENVINMYSRNTNPGKAVWVCNSACIPTLASMALVTGSGGVPVWMPAGGVSGVPYNTLFGQKLVLSDHASAPNTVGDIAFVDFSQILLGKKSGGDVPAFDTSIHLKFDYGQTAFRFQVRFDIRPWWRTYYTPPKATTTYKSPIVLLATRS
jgi:HK97 family phage major capsid protein